MRMFDYMMEKGIKSLIFWVIGVLALWSAFSLIGISPLGAFPHVPSAKWQAVFLNNNQVYFGKLQNYDGNYLTLSDVYYLKTVADLTQGDSASNLNLIKLGGELHGPEDVIYIPKSSVLFWENMKDTSRVVQSIIGSKK